LLLVATVIVFLNVILRRTGFAVTWIEEGSRFLIAWLTFIGGALCAKYGEHVGIDLLIQFTPPKITKFIITITQLIASIFTFIFAYYGWLLVLTTKTSKQISTGVMMPMWLIYLCIPIGCLLMSIRFLQRAVTTIKTKEDVFLNKATTDDISRL